jgi:hypothetical protein
MEGTAAVAAIATVRQKTSLGGRYTFHEGDGRAVYASAEYRWTRFRLPDGDVGKRRSQGSEVYARLGIDF